jgi:hypothetical protein
MQGLLEGTFDIVCTGRPEPQEITMNTGFLCTTHITQQSGVGPVTYHTVETEGKETVTVEIAAHNLRGHHEGLCGEATVTNGTYEGKLTLRGTDSTGNTTNLTISP